MSIPDSIHQSPFNSPPPWRPRLTRPPLEDLASHIAHRVIPASPSGCTIDPRTWLKPEFQAHIHLASMWGLGQKFKQLPASTELVPWLIRVDEFLDDPDKFIGWWQNPESGLYYLDLTVACMDRRAAEQVAVIGHEKAIFHPATGMDIRINRDQWYEHLFRDVA